MSRLLASDFYGCARCPFKTRYLAEFRRHRQGHILGDEAKRRVQQGGVAFTAEQLERRRKHLFE